MKVPELKGGQMITIAYLIGIVIALYIVYKILDAVGLLKTPTEKRADLANQAAMANIRVDDYFDPDYYTDKSFNSLDVDTAQSYAKELRSAMQFTLNTDEEAIYSIFGSLPSKTAISQLAWYYKEQYGFPFYIMSDNLRVDLLNNLKPAKMNVLLGIINKLPNQ